MKIVQPGAGIHADPTKLDASGVERFASAGPARSAADFFLHLIPDTMVGAFAQGDILQVLLVAILFGIALAIMGSAGRPVLEGIEAVGKVLFRMIGLIMYVAPLGAFGAMAFTLGAFGTNALLPLAKVILSVWLTCFAFVVLVLSLVLRYAGIRLWPLLRYLREEILLVLGTCSSEAALPGLIGKLERMGCSRSVVGLVVPSGYSFKLGALTEVFGGTCVVANMCPAKFACVGCARNAPDPA